MQSLARLAEATGKLSFRFSEESGQVFAGKSTQAKKRNSLTRRFGQLMQKKGGLLGRGLRAVNARRLGTLTAENREEHPFGPFRFVKIATFGNHVQRTGNERGGCGFASCEHQREFPGIREERPICGKQTHWLQWL